jgi:hypothetical protein
MKLALATLFIVTGIDADGDELVPSAFSSEKTLEQWKTEIGASEPDEDGCFTDADDNTFEVTEVVCDQLLEPEEELEDA